MDKHSLQHDQSKYTKEGVYSGAIYRFNLHIRCIVKTRKKNTPIQYTERKLSVITKYGALEYFNNNKKAVAFQLNVNDLNTMSLVDFDVTAITNIKKRI